MDIKDTMVRLSEVLGASGGEHAVSALTRELMLNLTDEVEVDALGNVAGILRAEKEGAKTIMLCAHIDQIGFMVTEITKEGFLRFVSVGGVDPRMLLGSELWVITQNHGRIKGVVSSVPPHLQAAGDQKKALLISEMTLDIGMEYERAKEVVSIGDYMTFSGELLSLQGDVLCGKSLDDRACLLGVLKAVELLKTPRQFNIIAAASIKEEVGGHGAQALTHRFEPDMTIVVDVCHAKTSDSKPSDRTQDFGGGPVLNIGYCSRPQFFERACEIARAKKIPHQVSAISQHSGTDADTVYAIGQGYNTLVIGLPLKYMHSPVEMVKISDIENLAKLTAALSENLLKEGY